MLALVTKAQIADEASLVARARRQDEAAVRSLVRQHNRRLFRIARSIVRNEVEAEDVVQETYLKAFSKLADFRGDSSFGTWLCRIALNEALGRLRRRGVRVGQLEHEELEAAAEIIPFPLSAGHADPERIMIQNEVRGLLERAIDGLPETFRCVLVARLIEGMSVAETAELFELREETVKTRLHRARQMLRQTIDDQIGPALAEVFPFDGLRCIAMADIVAERLGFSEFRGNHLRESSSNEQAHPYAGEIGGTRWSVSGLFMWWRLCWSRRVRRLRRVGN